MCLTDVLTFCWISEVDQDNYNLCLIKAIQLDVHANCKLDLKEAEMRLTVLDSNMKSDTSNRNRTDMTTSALLKSCSMIERPISKQWLDIGDFAGQPVSLYTEDSFSKGGSSNDEGDGGNGNGGGGKLRDLTVCIQSVSKESINQIFADCLQLVCESATEHGKQRPLPL
jgi:hypothetical protein